MLIDTHIHIFADSLAPRVLAQLQSTAGIAAQTDLTEKTTRAYLRAHGIDLAVVMPIATKPHQQRTINDWAAGLQHDGLISFGTVHPFADDALAELERLKTLGLYGVKLHPDYQRFEVNDRAVYPVYEKAAGLGLPVLFHAGFDPVSPDHTRCTPQALAELSEALPELTIIGAHLGGNAMYDDVLRFLAGRNLYLDISMAPLYATYEQFTEILRRHDRRKILFASDCPWSDPDVELRWVDQLPFSEEEKDDIRYRNALRLLHPDLPEKSGM